MVANDNTEYPSKAFPIWIIDDGTINRLSGPAMRVMGHLLPDWPADGEPFEPVTASAQELGKRARMGAKNAAAAVRELLDEGIFIRLNTPKRGQPGQYLLNETPREQRADD